VVRVTGSGEIVNTASVKADQRDLVPENNSATARVNTPAPPPPPSPPTAVVAAPKLTHRRAATSTALRASRSGQVATVGTLVAVDGKATVVLTVRDPRSGKQVVLLTGSKLAATTLKRQAVTVKSLVGAARTFTVKALLPTRQLSRGAAYQLTLTATGTTGKTSTIRIRFLG